MSFSRKVKFKIAVDNSESITSLNQLEQELKKLKKQIRGIPDVTSPAFKKMSNEIKEVDSRVNKLKRNMSSVGKVGIKSTSMIGQGLKSLISPAGLVVAAVGLVIRGLVSAIDIIKNFDESVADLAKTTNLSKDAARSLAKEIIKIDTRTSVTNLLKLASAAGRLGLKGSDIKDFTQAADKTFVALGDSLSGTAEDIALTLGKIGDNFGINKKFGISESINKIGSTLNAMGASTKATEGPIIDFTQRLAGLATQANISYPDVVALGTLFDESGQSMRVAASVIKRILPVIGANTIKFAKIAGVGIKDFKQLLEKDAVGALKLVAKGAKSTSGGVEGLSKTLEAYGIKSSEATSIIGILGQKTERLTKLQKDANIAFQKATSIENEVIIKQSTLSAKTEKLSKNWDVMILSIEDGNGIFSEAASKIVNVINTDLNAITVMNTKGTAMEKSVKIGSLFASSIGLITKEQAKVNINLYKGSKVLDVLSNRLKNGTITLKEYNKAIKMIGEGWLENGNKSKVSSQEQSDNFKNSTKIIKRTINDINSEIEINKKKLGLATNREEAKIIQKSIKLLEKEKDKILDIAKNTKLGRMAIKLKSLQEEEKVIDDVAKFRITAAKAEIVDEKKRKIAVLDIQRKANSDKIKLIEKTRIKTGNLSKEDIINIKKFADKERELRNSIIDIKNVEKSEKILATIKASIRKKFIISERNKKQAEFEDEISKLTKNGTITAEIVKALKIKLNLELDIIDRGEEEKKLQKQELDIENSNLTFGETLSRLKNEQDLITDNTKIGEEARTKLLKDNADAQKNIELAKRREIIGTLNILSSATSLIGSLAGKGTAVAKTAAIAQIGIGTATGFIHALTIAQESATLAGPGAAFAMPLFYASQVIAVLSAAAQARKILAKTKGGGGSVPSISVPSISAPGSAPTPNLLPPAPVNGNQIDNINSGGIGNRQNVIKAVVVESDITTAQNRISNIENFSEIG